MMWRYDACVPWIAITFSSDINVSLPSITLVWSDQTRKPVYTDLIGDVKRRVRAPVVGWGSESEGERCNNGTGVT
jgi:hypothetical protein